MIVFLETQILIGALQDRLAILGKGLFLSADQGGGGKLYADRSQLGEWEQFTPVSLGDGKFALMASNRHYIVAEGGGGGEVNASRSQRGEWETLILQSAN